jgi:hypothetical protein
LQPICWVASLVSALVTLMVDDVWDRLPLTVPAKFQVPESPEAVSVIIKDDE